MKYNAAITLPVNPPSVSPILTQSQCWEGLIVKAREPQAFVPISECTITEDRGDAGITRRVKFIEGKGPVEGEAVEVITYFKPMKVKRVSVSCHRLNGVNATRLALQLEFHMLEATLDVTNFLSFGSNDELYLTFAFAMEFPGVEEGSAEANKRADRMRAMGLKAVQQTIDVTRQLVTDGKL